MNLFATHLWFIFGICITVHVWPFSEDSMKREKVSCFVSVLKVSLMSVADFIVVIKCEKQL
jgi:tellurite resistance protein TehA-like permease